MSSNGIEDLSQIDAAPLLQAARRVSYRVHTYPMEREDAEQEFLLGVLLDLSLNGVRPENGNHRKGVNWLRRTVRRERKYVEFFKGRR